MKTVIVYLISFLLLIAQSACADRSTDETIPKTVILGIDGMDSALAQRMMAEGRLPNLSRMNFSSLRTTMPPQSPVAWSTFITGTDPSGHGIFDFIHRKTDTLEAYLSTAETIPPTRFLRLGGYRFPLDAPKIRSLRKGVPFWRSMDEGEIPITLVKLPANFPPEGGKHVHSLSGMGTPDLLGGYGSFTLLSAQPEKHDSKRSGGRVVSLQSAGENRWLAQLEGPSNPYREDPRPVSIPISVLHNEGEDVAILEIEGLDPIWLQTDRWSDWARLRFKTLGPIGSIYAVAKFLMLSSDPLEIYITPLNLDPAQPAMPISSPPEWSAHLAEVLGGYYTQGMPEDTKALGWGVWDHARFLAQTRMVFEERKRMLTAVLSEYDRGLLFFYFSTLDQASHIFWGISDPQRPTYDAELKRAYGSVVENLYEEIDAIVGEVARKIGPEATLIVMSDHGFTDYKRGFDLNRWLEANGYQKWMRKPTPTETPSMNDLIDWPNTRAYALGFNALYLNVKGREPMGSVPSSGKAALESEIAKKLAAVVDPKSGARLFDAVHRSEERYKTPNPDAPDILLGYAEGYGASWSNAAGEIGVGIWEDNEEPWIAGHCVESSRVPGVLFANRPIPMADPGLEDLGGWINRLYGIEWESH